VQWHWGNIGSAAAGRAAFIAAVAAVYGIVKYGPAWLRDSRERQKAQAAAAREQEALAREQAEQIRRDRRRSVHGWSGHGVNSYEVALVTSAAEMDQAKAELLAGNVPSDHVILKRGPWEFNTGASAQVVDNRTTAPHSYSRETCDTLPPCPPGQAVFDDLTPVLDVLRLDTTPSAL
jgi:hypothetical protein